MTIVKLSRREFLQRTGLTAGGLVLATRVTGCGGDAYPRITGEGTFEPNVYVAIEPDGTVRLTAHRSEMGQGIRTACAMLLADELDIAWEQIRLEQADGDEKYGDQNTDGSRSVRTFWEPLRHAGAAGRAMLVRAAAEAWGVDPGECGTEVGEVVHVPSGRRRSYASLAERASAFELPEAPPLKAPEQFRYIGKPRVHVDAADVVQGKTTYGGDVLLPGMLFASLERSPTVKGSVRSYDEAAALAVPGVRRVVKVDRNDGAGSNEAIAVVAETTWAALQGRRALGVEWEPGPLAPESSDTYAEHLRTLARQPGRVIREHGNVDAVASSAARTLDAVYEGPYLAHAPMEPPAVTAWVHDGQCEVWAPSQSPQWARSYAARGAGVSFGKTTCHVTLLGGGFGRKSKPDFAFEAARLARQLDAPVRVMWTREDEIRHGFYRAQNCQYLRATLDADGRPTGWLHRTVFPGIDWDFPDGGRNPSDIELSQGFSTIPYRIPAMRLEAGRVPSSVRIGWWRSVCNTFHAFAIEGFVDELALAAGRDPVEYRLSLLDESHEASEPYRFDDRRMTRVIRETAAMGLWGREVPAGHAIGFASHYSFYTFVGMAMHVSTDGDGRPVVHEVDTAVDCGQVVNPDTIVAQMQGAVVFGLSAALYGKITLRDGVVQQGNFHDYPLLRFNQMPKVNVRIVESDAVPTGIGEPGVPPVAPALTNALARATGTRHRILPIVGPAG